MSSTTPQPPSCGKTSVTAILIVVLQGIVGGAWARWRVTVGNLYVSRSLPGQDNHEAHQEPANTTCERGVSQTERGQSHGVVEVVVEAVVVFCGGHGS